MPETRTTRLCLHCGWPRTGTTSLQALLAEHREPLEAAGIVYPKRWERKGPDNHNGLVELLDPPPADTDSDTTPGEAVQDFQDYARRHTGKTLLLSSEELTFWRVSEGSQASLSALFASFREVGPLTCIATIRRVDDLFSSLFLHHMLGEQPLPTPERYFEQTRPYIERLITAMSEMAEDVDELTCVRYRPSGAHQGEILEGAGVPPDLREQMTAQLRSWPRLNARLTHKTVTALLNRETLAARAGAPIGSRDLRQLHWADKLRFENDMPCELLGTDLRRSLHEEALEVSRRVGFAAYAEFFEHDEVVAPAPTSPDPDVLRDEDIEHLVAQLATVESGR
jgi:hypothetical protein